MREYPDKPGVYLMKDEAGETIYVGKAKSLRNRIRSYFVGEKDIKTRFLLAHAKDIEVIITTTEYEALILENNLIKQAKPRYNINLKDGKTYPVIRITAEEFPRVFRTRRMIFDGSEYYGPFPKPQAIDLYLRLIERHFPLRKCRGPLKSRTRPCLNYHMGRCSAPCCGKTSREEYLRIVDGVRKLLSGRSEELLRDLAGGMKEASERQEFEKAARLRDQITAIEEVSADQKVMEFSEEDRDYIALAPSAEAITIVVMQVRGGMLLGKEVFRVAEYAPDEEALSHFIARYYGERKAAPDAVYVSRPVDMENLSAYLREISARKIALKMPVRGRHAQLLAMAEENAREEAAKVERGAALGESLEALKGDLGLAATPHVIEGFDVAHLEGQDTVASMVTFVDGRPDRRLYRAFTIRSLNGKVDDFEAIREAVARRYTRVMNEGLARPDLILIDGGKGQLSAAKGVLESLGLGELAVAGLAKQHEEIHLPGREEPLVLEEASAGLRILQAVRDESHRFSTTLHKNKRAKRVGLTLLERAPGIGRHRSQRLIEAFGSVEGILSQSPEEIQKRTGIPKGTAATLLALLGERYSTLAAAAEDRGDQP